MNAQSVPIESISPAGHVLSRPGAGVFPAAGGVRAASDQGSTMHAEPDRDFFLLAGVEWAGYAAGGAACRPVAAVVYREAACCHLLFRAGKYAAVLARLRAVRARVFGAHPPDGPQPGANPDAAQTLAVAADLFHRLRLALVAPDAVAALC